MTNYTRRSYAYDIKSLVHFDYYIDESKSYYKDEINNGVIWHRNFPISNDSINNNIEKLLLKEEFQTKIPYTGNSEPNDILIEDTPKFGQSCPLFTDSSYISGIVDSNNLLINSSNRNEIEFFIKPLNKIHDSLIDINMFNDALIFEGHTFKIFKENLSWNNANKKCKELNAHLATSTTISKQNFLNGFIKITNNQNNIFWLDGEFIDGDWKWNNEDFFIYKNWSDNYNENNLENNIHKITLNNNKWDAINTNELHYYICEWDFNVLYEYTNIENFEKPYNYNIYNNHTYKIIPINVSWETANEICKNLGGNLVSINNQEEQNFINNIIEKPYSYWIGANNYKEQWLWVNNNEYIKYTNWYENQPDSGENSCIRILSNYDGKWVDDHSNDISCYFICEWNNNKLIETQPIIYNKTINIQNNKNFFFGNKRYQYFSEFLSWDEAVEKCEKFGGNLLTITSNEEKEFITEMIKELNDDSDIWLGAYSTDNKNWQWITGEKWQYTNWYNTEIDLYNLEQKSVLRMIDGNYWIDEDNYYGNGKKYKYICEWGQNSKIEKELKNNIITISNNNTNNSFIFGLDKNNNFAININDNIISSNTKPIYNEWQHIYIRINNKRISIYLNSNLILFDNIKNFNFNISYLTIGKFNGFIDEFIYKYGNAYSYEYNIYKIPIIPNEQYHSTLFGKSINNINIANNEITEINENCVINISATILSINDEVTINARLKKPDLYLNNLTDYFKENDEILFVITGKKNENAPDENIGKFAFRNIHYVYRDVIILNEPIKDEFDMNNLLNLYTIEMISVPIFNSLIINENATIYPFPDNNIIAFKVKNDCVINGKILTNEINDNNLLFNNMPDKLSVYNGCIFIICNDLTINNTAKIGSIEGKYKNNIMIIANKINIDDEFKVNNNNYIYLAYKRKYNLNKDNIINNVLNYNINKLSSLSSLLPITSSYSIWYAENLPEGLFIDEYTGDFYGRCNIPGTYYIKVIHETDSSYEEFERIIKVTQNDLSLAPYITSESYVECNMNNIFTYQITGKNLGNDYIFDIENNPSNMIIDHKSGLVTWEIPKDQKDKNIIFTVIVNSDNGIARKNIELKLLIPSSWNPTISNKIEEDSNITISNSPLFSTLLYQIHFDNDEINNIEGKYFIENAPFDIEFNEDTGILIWNIRQIDITNKSYIITFGKRNSETNEIYVYNKTFILSLESNKLEIICNENEDDLDTKDKIIKSINKNNGILNYFIKNNSNVSNVRYRIENAPEGMDINSNTGEVLWNYSNNNINNEYNVIYYIETGDIENPIILDSYNETIKLVRFDDKNYSQSHAYDWLCIYSNNRYYTIYSHNVNYCIAHIYYQMPNYNKYNRYYLDQAPDMMNINKYNGLICYHIKANAHTQYETIKVRITDRYGSIKQEELIFYTEIEDKKLISWKVINNNDITIYYQLPMTPYKVDSQNT